MRTPPLLLAALPLTLLTACGSSAVPDASDAHDIACRGYVLNVGSTDNVALERLHPGTDLGTDEEELHSVLNPIHAAAVSAGTTAGLSESDYGVFRKIAEAVVGVLDGRTTLDDGTSTVPAKVVAPLDEAVSAVHKLCY